MKGKTFLISGVALLVLVFFTLLTTHPKSMENTPTNQQNTQPELTFSSEIYIGDTKFSAAIASDNKSRERGLSGRSKLENNQAMIFDFKNSDRKRPGFWMKEMNFPIDIIWIKNGLVIDITKNVPAPELGANTKDLPLYYPRVPIDTVIEINAGLSDKLNIVVGTPVKNL